VLFLNEYAGSALTVITFVAAGLILYGFPRLNALKFGASFLGLLITPFILPPMLIGSTVTAFVLGGLFMILLGIKNLVFLRRSAWYAALHFSLLAVFGLSLSAAGPSFWGEAPMFLFLFLLFREFYRTMSTLTAGRLALSAAIQALAALELILILTILPIGFISAFAIFVIIMAVFSDVFLHHLNGRLSRRLILRDATFLIISSLVVMAASGWGLAG
jgi:hypothetical protein